MDGLGVTGGRVEKGVHSFPPRQTVRAVFPHTAFLLLCVFVTLGYNTIIKVCCQLFFYILFSFLFLTFVYISKNTEYQHTQ